MDDDLYEETLLICEEALAEVREWEHAFQTTRRRNGSIIPAGEPRDVVDTAETISKIVIEPTESGMDIYFANDDAYYILNKDDSYHREITEIMVEDIVEQVPVLLIQDLFRRAGHKVRILKN